MTTRTGWLALALLVGCGGGAEPEATPAEEPAADETAADALDEDAKEALAAADAHDGTVDHVVSECAVCGLGMQGDPAHAVTVGEYEVHLCSASCKGHFEENTQQTLERVAEIAR